MIKIIIMGIVILAVLIFISCGYVKAPPDMAYIISGLSKSARIVIGRATIKVPFLERLDKVRLNLMSVDVKTTSPVPTADYININVDAVVNIKVDASVSEDNNGDLPCKKKTSTGLLLAQQNFLNKDDNYIINVAREVLEGNMREIVGTMELRDMVSNRQKFADKVRENAAPDLAKMGLSVVSFNVQNFTDSQEVINNLGIDNISKIQKEASIAKANALRDVAIAQANANKQSNDAQVASDFEIAIKKNDLAIKQAELKKVSDIKKAEADAAYNIQKEQQRKELEITTAEANIARQTKEVEVENQKILIQERKLDAEIKKQADADLYSRQKQADAKKYEDTINAEAEFEVKKREAEAMCYLAEQNASAIKARAEADRYAAEQEAAGIESKGRAEAEAIKAKAIAEAEGLDKKAEAMKKMQSAAVLDMYISKLPEIARAVAEPLSNIDKITMYGSGNTSKLVEEITESTNQISNGLLDGMGISLKDLMNNILTGRAIGAGINASNTANESNSLNTLSSSTPQSYIDENPIDVDPPEISE